MTDKTAKTAAETGRPVTYMTIADVARKFADLYGIEIKPNTAAGWITRATEDHPIPVPDVRLGLGIKNPVPGWAEDRMPDWKAWYDGRIGRGAPGKPGARGKQDEKAA